MWLELAPAIIVLLGMIVGAVLLWRGLRGRLVGCAPTCGRCGYNLTGLTGERCPECGGVMAEAGVLVSRRERRVGLVMGGMAVLLPMVVLLGLRTAGIVRSLDVYRLMPTAWMLSDTQSSDPSRALKAYTHLQQRLKAGELSAPQVEQLADVAFAGIAPERRHGGNVHRMASELAGLLVVGGHLDAAEVRRRLGELVEVEIRAQLPKCRLATGIPVLLTVKYGEFPIGVAPARPLVWLVPPGTGTEAAARDFARTAPLWRFKGVPDKALAEQPHEAAIHYPGKACTAHRSWNVTVSEPGPKEFNFLAMVDLLARRGGRSRAPLLRLAWTFTVTSDVVAYPSLRVDDPPVLPSFETGIEVDGEGFGPRATMDERGPSGEPLFPLPGRQKVERPHSRTGGVRVGKISVVLTPASAPVYATIDHDKIREGAPRLDDLPIAPDHLPIDPLRTEAWQRISDWEGRDGDKIAAPLTDLYSAARDEFIDLARSYPDTTELCRQAAARLRRLGVAENAVGTAASQPTSKPSWPSQCINPAGLVPGTGPPCSAASTCRSPRSRRSQPGPGGTIP